MWPNIQIIFASSIFEVKQFYPSEAKLFWASLTENLGESGFYWIGQDSVVQSKIWNRFSEHGEERL